MDCHACGNKLRSEGTSQGELQLCECGYLGWRSSAAQATGPSAARASFLSRLQRRVRPAAPLPVKDEPQPTVRSFYDEPQELPQPFSAELEEPDYSFNELRPVRSFVTEPEVPVHSVDDNPEEPVSSFHVEPLSLDEEPQEPARSFDLQKEALPAFFRASSLESLAPAGDQESGMPSPLPACTVDLPDIPLPFEIASGGAAEASQSDAPLPFMRAAGDSEAEAFLKQFGQSKPTNWELIFDEPAEQHEDK